jgi:hypothetical protein
MGQARRELIDAWERSPELMRRVYKERARIERVFVLTPDTGASR